jgi:hypothetical protein
MCCPRGGEGCVVQEEERVYPFARKEKTVHKCKTIVCGCIDEILLTPPAASLHSRSMIVLFLRRGDSSGLKIALCSLFNILAYFQFMIPVCTISSHGLSKLCVFCKLTFPCTMPDS